MFRTTIAALSIALAMPAAAATTTNYTQDFNNALFDFTEYKPADYATSISYSDGVGRAVRYTYDHTGPNPTALRLQAISQTFSFDPSVRGTITSIGASMAISNWLYAGGTPINLSTLTSRLRLLARQDGKVYEAISALAPTGTFGTYRSVGQTGFTAADFFLFDPANPNAARTLTGLDFSGSAISFGFEVTPPGTILSNGQPSQGRIISVTDVNAFSVDIDFTSSVAAVPEPAQWALMIFGFGVVGGAARQRRMKEFATA